MICYMLLVTCAWTVPLQYTRIISILYHYIFLYTNLGSLHILIILWKNFLLQNFFYFFQDLRKLIAPLTIANKFPYVAVNLQFHDLEVFANHCAYCLLHAWYSHHRFIAVDDCKLKSVLLWHIWWESLILNGYVSDDIYYA